MSLRRAEDRDVYPVPKSIADTALLNKDDYVRMYKRSLEEPDSFWMEMADGFYWKEKGSAPLCKHNFDVSKGPISCTWFDGWTTNVTYNALDRHVEAGLGDKVAMYWEGKDLGNSCYITFKQLLDKVCQIANYLKHLGVGEGDDVTLYMPMVLELPAAMLACARIGAVHSVVFGGFSAESLAGRILDSKPRMVLTASGVFRGKKLVPLKAIVDDALKICEDRGHKVPCCMVYDHSLAMPRSDVPWTAGRDYWWQDNVDSQPSECAVAWLPAEAPLFKLYTSGSTGPPKGVLHTCAGYMVGAALTFKYVFDYKEGDIFWCTADCGWITGHSYVTYGPLFNAATQVVFEGIPTYPDCSRCWQVVDKYQVSLFYTAPTAIRALMAQGSEPVTKCSRASLRVLGTVGEPINPEVWKWYYQVVGDSRCPVMDTWWQTETGGHMITPLPGAVDLKPGSASLPFFGVEPAILDQAGNELQGEAEGYLVIKRPWPSMMRTVAGNHELFEKTYFHHYNGYYFTGDGARRDQDGYYWLLGRVDDVLNVSGHRIGTAEVESALVSDPHCAEAAVVAVEHSIKGQAIYAFVTLMTGIEYPPPDDVRKGLIAAVRTSIGPIATPETIHWAPGLPKTRSGKIMRRILRKIANNEEDSLGDTSTLADPSVIETLLQLRGK